MSNWLDEAERRSSLRQMQGHSERLQVRIDRIRENYERNREVYDKFISGLKKLVMRANNLPPEFREPFGKISFKSKPTRLQNHLMIFSSSQRIRKRKEKDFWSWFFPAHFKHIRVVFLSVSKHPDQVDLEIKEAMLEKRRMRLEERHNPNLGKPSREHTDLVIHISMGQLDDSLADKILDFLAFKCELKDIPIDFSQATFY
ncbi:MAG: hypothetical protein HPY80_02905 [Bacteroidales bacterium]|nr:hypothetical protein [Bacteroidales bacterium]